MASRRGLSSLGAIINSFSRLSLAWNPAAAGTLQQAAPLTSLRHVLSTQPAALQQQQQQQQGPVRESSSYSSRSFSTAVGSVEEQHPGPGPSESLEQVQSRIFGTYIGNGLRSGRKVLRQKLLGPTLVAYYPEEIWRKDPFMLSEKAERAKLKLDRLKRRGKAPPKKGAGKRAGKKK